MIRRSFFLSPLLAVLFCASSASAQLSETMQLRRIEAYLSELTTIIADFTQVAPDGSLASGKFFLKRPKQMRWQYNPPTPILMVTRGNYLTYYDYELDQISDIPLESTLLSILSKPNVSFAEKDITVANFVSEPGLLTVTLTQAREPDEGQLTLEFSDEPLRIHNIHVTDATGQTTHIALNEARFGASIDDDVFDFKDPRIGGRRRTHN